MATESRAGSGKRGRPYGGLTPDERRQDRRQRLIEAGLQEFGTVGYADTSIETLCRSAKVTPRYFYEFFASRERVLAAVYDRTSIEVLAGVSDAVSRAGSDGPAAMIRAGTGSFFSQLFEDPRKARILCVDSVGVSAEIEQSRRVCMHQFARLVSERGRLVLPGDDLPMDLFDIVALSYVGGVNELVIEHLFGFITASMETLIDQTADMLLDAMAGSYERYRASRQAAETAAT